MAVRNRCWDSDDYIGAISSPLRLPSTGYRRSYAGGLFNVGEVGLYWTSNVLGSGSFNLYFQHNRAGISGPQARSYGRAILCIKD